MSSILFKQIPKTLNINFVLLFVCSSPFGQYFLLIIYNKDHIILQLKKNKNKL